MLVAWTATGRAVPASGSPQARLMFDAPMLEGIESRILVRYSALLERASSANAASHESTSTRLGQSVGKLIQVRGNSLSRDGFVGEDCRFSSTGSSIQTVAPSFSPRGSPRAS